MKVPSGVTLHAGSKRFREGDELPEDLEKLVPVELDKVGDQPDRDRAPERKQKRSE